MMLAYRKKPKKHENKKKAAKKGPGQKPKLGKDLHSSDKIGE